MTLPKQFSDDDKPSGIPQKIDERKQWVSPRLKTYPIAGITHIGAANGASESVAYTLS